jgi:hypothetical protein
MAPREPSVVDPTCLARLKWEMEWALRTFIEKPSWRQPHYRTKRHEGSHEHCAIEQWLNITLADNKPKRDLFKTRKRCSLHCVPTLPFDGHQCAMCGAKYCSHECMMADEHMQTCVHAAKNHH